jgi:arthrofactin-type cyclic lipopeptide synthetase C
MMETPNIEVLGNALSYAIRSSEESASKSFQKRFSPLQTLQSGQYGRPPLFCVPGAGGSLATFVDLVNHLDKSWPIYALQPRGLDDLFVPHSTVPTAADCYLNAIEQFTSAGPVHLLGHSFGGWQVFEMALKLLHSGRTIASLTIVDSDSPDREDAPMREYSNTEVLIRWLEIFELMLGRPLEITSSDLDSLTEAGQRELLHSVLVREGLFPRRSEPDSLRGPLRIFAMSLRTQYTPNSTYPGPVRLVLVDDPKLDVHANRLAHHGLVKEWTRWAFGATSTRVSGNHLTVLKPPNVHALATLLNSEIAANQVGSLRRTRNATI